MKKLLSLLLATCLFLGLLPLTALADNSLVLHYDFADGAADTSGNGYDGTIDADSGASAALTQTGGKNNGSALNLTRGSGANGGYVELPTAALTAITGDWSMNLWVKLDDNPTWNHVFTMGTDQNHYLLIATKGGPGGKEVGVTMGLRSGGGEYRVVTDATQVPTVGEWNMLTFSQTGDQISIYLNGKPLTVSYHNQDMTADYTGSAVSWADVAKISGVRAHVGNSIIYPDPAMDGLLGEVALYSAAMDAGAVAELYEKDKATYGVVEDAPNLPTPSENTRLLMHYDFTGDTGTAIEDKAGDYDGTLGSDGGCKVELKANAGLTKGGQAVELSRGSNPNGGYITTPNSAFQAAGNSVTLSMWVKLDDNPTWNHLLSMGTDQSHYVLLATNGCPYGKNVGVTIGFNNGSGEYRVAAEPTDTVAPGSWAMITYCQDAAGRAAFYLNGQLVESTKCYYGNMTEKTDGIVPLGFGDVAGNNGGVYFGKNIIFSDPATDGLIGEIRLYDDVLSSEAIEAIYSETAKGLLEVEFYNAVEMVKGYDDREITASIDLPTEAGSGVTIAWMSGNSAVVSDEGELLARPSEADITVPMTAVITMGEKEERVTIELLVKAYTPAARVREDLLWADRYLDVIVNDTQTELPTVGGSGCEIAWAVTSGHGEIRDNILYKTEGAAENEPITLTATVSCGNVSDSVLVDDLVLKDAYVGQVMSYFTNNDDTRGLKLAYTYDLKNFMPLNGGLAVVKRTVGSNQMRDPSIFRKKDGTFGVANTDGWASPYIGLIDSVDLCTFTNERLVPTGFNGGQASHARSWAPEINYDRVSGQYYVYWSDFANNHPCYYNTTPDLQADTFSDAGVYFDIGINIIDSSIKWDNGQYHLVYKLENGAGAGYGTLLMAHSDTLQPGNWVTTQHPIGGTNAGFPTAEGPTWAKSYADGKYYVYADEFTTGGVTYYSNDDINDDYGWEYREEGEGSLAPDKVPGLEEVDKLVSHCGLISVTQKEIDRLVAYWGATSVEKGIFFTVLDAENPEALTVPADTAAEALELPETVPVQYDDGGWRDVAVTWDTASYQTTEGTYSLTGTIALAEDVKNSNGIAVELTVQVQTEGHNPVLVPAKESTCVEQGNVAYWHCDHCDQNFAEAEATVVLEDVTLPLDKDNHQHTTVKNQQHATPDHPGYTGDLVCTDCNAVLRRGRVIPQKAPAAPTEPEEPELTFVDVKVGSWYEEAVSYVAANDLMTGVGNGKFSPDGAVTRAMVWAVLARMAGKDTTGGITWYAKAREWVMETGVSDGTNPSGSITREQLTAMLYRYEGSPAVSGNLNAYPDANQVSDWAVEAMIWGTRTGIINGIGPCLSPKTGATRAQLAVMLMRQ